MSKDLQVRNIADPRVSLDPTPGSATGVGFVDQAREAPASDAVADSVATTAPPIAPGSELDEVERRAWRAFLYRHAVVARTLELDLMTRSDLPLAEFDVMFQLAQTEGHRLRMNELANRVLLSRAGITRLVDRLVADGLVARLKCASDARGAFAVLTDRGLARLEAARPGHLAAVKRSFLVSFTRPELETLAELMERSAPTD